MNPTERRKVENEIAAIYDEMVPLMFIEQYLEGIRGGLRSIAEAKLRRTK